MKKIVLLVVVMLVALTTYAQTTTNSAQDPTALANAFFKAMQDEDGGKMATLATDDFSIISFNGQTADRDLLTQALDGGYLVVENMTPTSVRARTYNNDAALVNGTSKFKGSLQGTAFDTEVTFTTMCVKQGSGWKIASVQLSENK